MLIHFLFILLPILSYTDLKDQSYQELEALFEQQKIDKREYKHFEGILDYRNYVALQSRLDSISSWKVDAVYIEEKYFLESGLHSIHEYYFTKNTDHYNKAYKTYYPSKYVENGKETSRYMFIHKNGKDHLRSIENHMKSKKQLDHITPIVKEEYVHAGCGVSVGAMKFRREHLEKQYAKAKSPNYFLIETFIVDNEVKTSFQIPVKSKYLVIFEGHSF